MDDRVKAAGQIGAYRYRGLMGGVNSASYNPFFSSFFSRRSLLLTADSLQSYRHHGQKIDQEVREEASQGYP